MKHLKVQIIFLIAAIIATFMLAAPSLAFASTACHPENDKPPGKALTQEQLNSCEACQNKAGLKDCLQNNVIIKRLQQIVDFLSAAVGIVVVAMIIIGGVQYSIAGDNPQKITAAKQRIANALLALVAFMFLFAFVQWLIPGGIFS
jgi:hypothetical protein